MSGLPTTEKACLYTILAICGCRSSCFATWSNLDVFLRKKVNEAKDAFVEVVSKEGRLYMLPDSSRVWMHPGSSIRYPENFVQNRKVWLKGNSHLMFINRKANILSYTLIGLL